METWNSSVNGPTHAPFVILGGCRTFLTFTPSYNHIFFHLSPMTCPLSVRCLAFPLDYRLASTITFPVTQIGPVYFSKTANPNLASALSALASNNANTCAWCPPGKTSRCTYTVRRQRDAPRAPHIPSTSATTTSLIPALQARQSDESRSPSAMHVSQ